MDCPACGEFNSELDEQCADCGFPLQATQRAYAPYRGTNAPSPTTVA